MKHILIDARESGTSTGRYIDKLVEYLHELPAFAASQPDQPDQLRYRVTLLAKPHRLEFLSAIAPSFSLQTCPYKEFSFGEQLGLKRQIERIGPDLVHFPAVQQPVWLRRSIPVVTTMQDLTTVRFRNPAKNPLVFTIKQTVYKWVNKRIAGRSAALIAPTEFVRQDVAAYCHVDPGRISVTWESADDLPLPAEPVTVDGLDDSVPFIMYTGRPTPHKNLERLIRAYELLRERYGDLRLVLVGKTDTNYERIRSSAERQGISGISFTGFVSDRQLRWLYEHCQAYVFPSLSEGFGLPGLEAMRHGAPVVSSNATCLPEVYAEAARYFDPLDVRDMADAVNDVLSDGQLRKRLIFRGHERIRHFSWQRMAEQTLAVYDGVLSE